MTAFIIETQVFYLNSVSVALLDFVVIRKILEKLCEGQRSVAFRSGKLAVQ